MDSDAPDLAIRPPPCLAADQVIQQVRDQAMFLVDPTGRIVSWNEGVRIILGWDEADWLGRPFQLAFTEDDVRNGVPESEMRCAAETGRADDTRWMRRRSGEPFFAAGSLTRMLDDHGRLIGFLKTLRDVSDYRRAEQDHERLVVRDAELRALVDGVRDYAIFTIDREGRISSWHPGAALMKGYSVQEAIGMHYAELFTPKDRAARRPELEMRVAAETGEFKGEGLRLRKDGSTFEAAVVLTALRGPDGQLLGYLKLTQDISQRRQAEREREQALRDAEVARADAERASRIKEQFLATVSHELRTPLSAIQGWAHVLERGAPDEKTLRHGLSAISRNAGFQVQLIEDLLDINRIESGQLLLDRQPVDLGEVVAAAVDAALPAAIAKDIGLRTVAVPSAARVLGDAMRLQQVVGKLLANAIKFTPSGGQVSVSVTRREDTLEIAVADSGQGLSADFLPRLFERFQQQDVGSTRRHGGAGLGLAIVQQLVRLHGGSVRAHSRGPGLGATFTVVLPAAGHEVVAGPDAEHPTGPAVATGHADTTTAATRLDGLTVLLVDDEPDVRAATVRVLQDAGAHVLAADRAEVALEMLRRERPAVILSDIAMPVTDGYALMRRVRQLPPAEGGQTPAAAFTAFARTEDRDRALQAGYHLHFPKPVAPAALVAGLARLVQDCGDTRERASGPPADSRSQMKK